MGNLTILSLVLLLRALSADSAYMEAARDVTSKEPSGSVVIALTSFDVNDQTLALRYRITNRTDYDVWICDSIRQRYPPLPFEDEVYMDSDGRTLVIRRQIEVPRETVGPVTRNYDGRYVLLHSGEERRGSLSLGVPVERHVMLAAGGPAFEHATRLVLRIGLFDEDLPGKIRSILELAARLGCAQLDDPVDNICVQYFQGLWLSRTLGGLSGFNGLWTEGSEQIKIPYTSPPLLGDESCLEIAIDGVFIPVSRY